MQLKGWGFVVTDVFEIGCTRGAQNIMKFWRRKTILTSIEPLQLPPSGAGGRKQEVVVGLHLGTSYSSYAFAHKSNPEVIITNYDSPSEPFRNAATLTAIYYKPEVGVENGDLHFRSWGYEARKEFTKDLAAVRKLRQQAATSVNVQSSGEIPVLGFYITPLKQHVSSSDAGPSSASKLPPGLTLNRVISDYLRAMGKFILLHLQHYCFSYSLSMEDVQWCVTVPSIWSHNPQQQMKSCMVDAGLVVGGSNGMNASSQLVIIVLQTDAASYCSCKKLSLQPGDKVLLANIGYDTTDVVVQEWVGCEGANNFKVFKDLTPSSSGLCGRFQVEKQFIEFLCQKIEPLGEYLLQFPDDTYHLQEEWERGAGMPHKFIDLPSELGVAWEKHNKRLGLLHPGSYHRIELSYTDTENILKPTVEANLDLIAAQLSQTSGILVIAVVGSLDGSSYLERRIRSTFGDKVGEIAFVEAHYETVMCKGAVKIAQDCFPGPGAKTFDLVVEIIDNVLLQTRQKDDQDWANNNCVRVNWGQCNHLANKLAEMKDWLLKEHQNSEIISWDMHRVLPHLLRVVIRADLLVQECCKSKEWIKAAVLQAGNEEAFVGILHELKWWCTHFLSVNILSGMSSSQHIQSQGDVGRPNWFEKDDILGRMAVLDRKELVANLMRFKRHEESDVMVDHLLDRYSQQASNESIKVDSPLLLWNTQDDNTPLISEDLLGRGAHGVVFKSTWLGRNCAKKVFMGAENVSFKKEADILAALKHPNIIQLFCCTTDAKSCSLVMELMSTDLCKLMDDKMKDRKHVVPFSLPVAVDIMLQVARGLKYMHEQRVGHRDIKSSNILVNPTSVPKLAEMGYLDVKVADFGLAKAKLMSLTVTMQTKDIGTTQYRAPELYTQVSHNSFVNDDLSVEE